MSFLRDMVRASGHDLWQHGWTSLGGGGFERDLDSESRRTSSGETVTQERALSLTAYFAALRNISQDVAKLPRQLRKRRETRGTEVLREHPAAVMIRHRPNPVMGGFQFVQTMQFRVMGWGNAYAELVRDNGGSGKVVEMWPIHPSRMTPVLGKDGRTLTYEWRLQPGSAPIPMPARDIFHLRGMGSGVRGMSVLQVGAEAIGLGLAAQRNAARFFSEGMAKRQVVFSKSVLSAPGRKALRQRILEDQKADPDGRRKLPIIEGDYNLGEMGIAPEDAQLLESRQFTTEELARLIRIALEKIQHHRQAKGWSSLEQLNTDHANDTLYPWCISWEEECYAKLLTEEEQADHYFKWLLQGLLRGDSTARTAYYDSGLRNGWLSRNDVRELEDMDPIEGKGGDEYLVQAQMTPVDQAGQTKPTAPPAPPPAEDDDEDLEQEDDEPDARAALAPVFLDVATRLITKESHALRREMAKHAGNAKAFNEWAAGFYVELRRDATLLFTPAMLAVCKLTSVEWGQGVQLQNALDSWFELWSAEGQDWASRCGRIAKGDAELRARTLASTVESFAFREPSHA